MDNTYGGARVLVTGASKGLGRAFALELARRGAEVILLARSEGDLQKVAAEIRGLGSGPDAVVITGDLAEADGPRAILRKLEDRQLTVDLLINNAGAGSPGPFLRRPLAPQLAAVRLNVDGVLSLSHAIGAEMVARGSGGIINVSSTGAFQPMPYVASYSATKAFVLSFTEALAEELRGTGVRVMAAHPGAMDTGFFDGTSASVDPRADTPEAIASGTLDDYARGRSVSYPGRTINRVRTWVARLLPRPLVARIAGDFNRRQGMHTVVDTDRTEFDAGRPVSTRIPSAD